MKNKDALKLSFNIFFLSILFFIIFIVLINLFKFADYYFQVKKIILLANDNRYIPFVNSNLNKVNKDDKSNNYIFDKSYKADELGFKNDLFDLNGSEWGKGINIMLVGSDKKSYRVDKSRSDVIVVFRINSYGRVLSISIPRDSLIKINDGKWSGYYDKIGHSLYWGGMDNLKRSVEELLGSPIYKVAIIDNFENFEAFLAIAGGIKVDKNLNGKLGIQWIRNRSFKDGDIERCKRQQVFIKKSVKKLWLMSKDGNYFYSSFFYDMFKSTIYTDLTKYDFLKIILILKENNFNPDKDFLTGVLPGDFGKYDSKLLNRNNLVCYNLDEKFISNLRFLFYSNNDSYNVLMKKNAGLNEFISVEINHIFNNNKPLSDKKLKVNK